MWMIEWINFKESLNQSPTKGNEFGFGFVHSDGGEAMVFILGYWVWIFNIFFYFLSIVVKLFINIKWCELI